MGLELAAAPDRRPVLEVLASALAATGDPDRAARVRAFTR